MKALLTALAASAGLVEFIPGLFLPTLTSTSNFSLYIMSNGRIVVSGIGVEANLLRSRLAVAGLRVDGVSTLAA